jgi:hypothetical protein
VNADGTYGKWLYVVWRTEDATGVIVAVVAKTARIGAAASSAA